MNYIKSKIRGFFYSIQFFLSMEDDELGDMFTKWNLWGDSMMCDHCKIREATICDVAGWGYCKDCYNINWD